MACFGLYSPKTPSPPGPNQRVVLCIPGCTVHLMAGGEVLEIGYGDFIIVSLFYDGVFLAILVKIGEAIQWPLTMDEPVLKIGRLRYIFSLPVKGGDGPLNYGVAFTEYDSPSLSPLDSFLLKNACFSAVGIRGEGFSDDWKRITQNIQHYNGMLVKAADKGSGHYVKGVFKCSGAYSKQVQNGGEIMCASPAETHQINLRHDETASAIRTGLKRVRKISRMTQKLSEVVVDAVGATVESALAALLGSQTAKVVMSSKAGQIVLASLDAFSRVAEAIEVAQIRAMVNTSGAAGRLMADRYGEEAAEAAEDVLAAAGHCVGTLWNIFKIRAISVHSSIPKQH